MALIKKDGGFNALPIGYKRGNPIPLDTTAVWYNLDELKAYAKEGVTAYVGQVLTYVNETSATATAYVIKNTAGDLQELATSAATGDLDADLSNLQEALDSAVDRIEDLENLVGSAEDAAEAETVFGAIAAEKARAEAIEATLAVKATTLAGYGITDAYTKAETDAEIAKQVVEAGHAEFKIVPSLPAAADASTTYIYMIKDNTAVGGDLYKEYVLIIDRNEDGEEIGRDFVQIGDTSTDLRAYAKTEDVNSSFNRVDKAIEDEVKRAEDAEEALGNRVKAIEDDYLVAADKTALEGLISAEETRAKAAEKANADAIAEINGENGILDQAKEYTDAQIGDLGDKATVKAYVDGKVEEINDDIDGLDSRVQTLEEKKIAKADLAETLKVELEGKLDAATYEAYIASHAKTDSELATDIDTAKTEAITAAGTNADNKIANKVGAIGDVTVKDYVDGKITTANGEIAKKLDASVYNEYVAVRELTDAEINTAVADAKAAGTNANTALETYKSANDAAVAANKKAIEDEAKRADEAEKANAQAIAANAKTIEDEIARADTAEKANAKAIEDEAKRADEAEKANAKAIEDEAAAARAAEKANADAIAAEKLRAEAAEKANADAIEALESAAADAYAAKAYEGKVDTLIGDDASKSVRTIANEELAKQLIPENASEALDTLAEIAAWIQAHPGDASAMNEAIVALQNQVKGIDAGEGTVKKYVDDAITALKIGDYALAADLTALANRVKAIEDDYLKAADKAELSTAIETAESNAAADATTKANAAEKNAKDYVDEALTWTVLEDNEDVE